MALTYTDIGTHIFGEKEFSSGDFARRTGNPRAAKLLSELLVRGVVTRNGRGRYRFLRPAERPDLCGAEWERVRNTILESPLPKAWDGPSAVEAWTDGRYKVSPSLYSRVFCIAVPESKIADWIAYLSRRGVSTRARKRVGARVELRGISPFRTETVDGEPVIPREEVSALIREHPGVYANAETLLRDRPRSS